MPRFMTGDTNAWDRTKEQMAGAVGQPKYEMFPKMEEYKKRRCTHTHTHMLITGLIIKSPCNQWVCELRILLFLMASYSKKQKRKCQRHPSPHRPEQCVRSSYLLNCLEGSSALFSTSQIQLYCTLQGFQ